MKRLSILFKNGELKIQDPNETLSNSTSKPSSTRYPKFLQSSLTICFSLAVNPFWDELI